MMRTRAVQVMLAAIAAVVLADPAQAEARTKHRFARATARAALAKQRTPQSRGTSGKRATGRRSADRRADPPLRCGDYLGFQVLLDRQGFSPGQIDGRQGSNFDHAIAAFQAARGLPAAIEPDCDTWNALGGQSAPATIGSYIVTENDLKGPFEPQIPKDLVEQAKLPSLGYQSPLEKIAERFHASPALLQRLNGAAPFAAGREIRVPAVTPFDPDAKPPATKAPATPMNSDVTLVVARADSSLRATRADGTVVLFAPVTTGSEHDPLPIGDYKVTAVLWQPPFHYNPNLFWDSKPGDEKATIKPGPNNPVGIAWISLSLEHYGLHGTPQPGNVGHTESHGCVRLTNWDAARVAALVRPGTSVQFR